jgi:YidC/Oxa1 family membrane protein insertase
MKTELQSANRYPIDTAQIHGSINLQTGRFDDVTLKQHFETLKKDSPNVRVFSPSTTEKGFFADFGYTASGTPLVDNKTGWTAKTKNPLTENDKIILTHTADGVTIERTIALDDHFMFNITDNIINNTKKDIAITPYALLKKNYPEYIASHNPAAVHTGFVGWIDNALEEVTYSKIKKESTQSFISASGGWIGLTETYFMAALIPDAGTNIRANVRYNPYANNDGYQTDYVTKTLILAPNQVQTVNYKLFAGAKSVAAIEKYRDAGISGFDYAVDWGWFWYFTKPIFKGLVFLYGFTHNYGIAILLLTLVIKALFFPLANKSYTAMSKMKKLQPLMEELRAKYGDDPLKQQQELIALYKKEKVNPVAGCWPLLLQIPVFYALYKVLNVSLELRHAPFFGWIQDLSAKDPSSIFNLFGLLPYDPSLYIPAFLNIGILPILMGITMWLQQRLNPASPDPIQARLMSFFPLVFTFVLGSFASGLVLYWTWNNILSVLQQAVIMKRLGVPVDFRLFPKKEKASDTIIEHKK